LAGRPSNTTPAQQAQIAAWVEAHGPTVAAQKARKRGWACSAPTALRYHRALGGQPTSPETRAAARVAAAPAATPGPTPPPAAQGPQEAPPDPAAPTPAQLPAPQSAEETLQELVQRLRWALGQTTQPRELAALAGQLDGALQRLEQLQERAQKRSQGDARFRVVLYLPERRSA